MRSTPAPAPTPRPVPAPVTPIVAPPTPITAPPVATPAPVAATPVVEPLPTATPTGLPAVEPTGDEGRLTLRNTLAGLSDLGPTIAIAAGVLLVLGLLLWFFRRRSTAGRYDETAEDSRSVDRHERFDLGVDMRVAPEPAPAQPPVAPPPPERVPFEPAADRVAPAAAPPVPETAGDEAPPPLAEDLVVPAAAPAVAASHIDAPDLTQTATTGSRAALHVALLPRRAGTNLTSAAVEYDVVVQNGGSAAATSVRLDVRLLTAGAQQDTLINALFAEPVDRPITPPFDLPPGTEIRLGGMGILPREQVGAMTVDGRPLFVPVMTVNLSYDWSGGSGQTARSFVIGIRRAEGTRMGAFRLDEVRMYAEVGAIEYTIAVDR